jgi:hypothetical protein
LSAEVLKPDHIDVPRRTCECAHCKDPQSAIPYRLVLFCPNCGNQHVDEGEWATKKHKIHRCVDADHVQRVLAADGTVASEVLRRTSGCGFEWRPAHVFTVGVGKLGG